MQLHPITHSACRVYMYLQLPASKNNRVASHLEYKGIASSANASAENVSQWKGECGFNLGSNTQYVVHFQ